MDLEASCRESREASAENADAREIFLRVTLVLLDNFLFDSVKSSVQEIQALARIEDAVVARKDRADASKAHFKAESTLLSRLSFGPISLSDGRRAEEERVVTGESTDGTLSFLMVGSGKQYNLSKTLAANLEPGKSHSHTRALAKESGKGTTLGCTVA